MALWLDLSAEVQNDLILHHPTLLCIGTHYSLWGDQGLSGPADLILIG